MAIIGSNFPMTRSARKDKLAVIKQGTPVSTAKVPGKGAKSVFRIPLEFISYNPYNTRFLAQAKTLEKRFGRELSDEIPDHVKEIEKFIWDEKLDRNKNTIYSLIKEGQLQPGVVTADGVVLAGNRRFRLLNEIARNPDKYTDAKSNISGLEYFEAVILDEEQLSKKDIIKYESFYQFGVEEKVEYNPIQKYIAAYDQKQLGFTEKEIANNFITLTQGQAKTVTKWLDIYQIMMDYLEYIEETGIYTALEGREEAFIQLYTLLRIYRKGKGTSWAYTDNDLTDFKLVFFDYIRLNIPTHDFRIFKEIFSDEQQWKRFESDVKDVVSDEKIKVQSFDEIRIAFPEDNEAEISKRRQNEYIAKVEKDLNRLYGVENARVISKQAEEKPIEILNSIKQKLTKLENDININPDKSTFQSEEFLEVIKEIQKRVGRIKQQVD